MLNLQTYNQSYAYEKYANAKDYDELLTAFVEDVSAVSAEYTRRKFDRAVKNIDDRDQRMTIKHQSALPLEIALDTSFSQFISFILNDQTRDSIQQEYSRQRRGRQIVDTPLNRLSVKINNSKRVIELFRDSNRLIVKQYYRYEDQFLYMSEYGRIKFHPDTASDLILRSLFKNKSKSCSTKLLKEKIGKLNNDSDDDHIFEQLNRACEHINQRVLEATNNPLGLISCTKQVVRINVALLRD